MKKVLLSTLVLVVMVLFVVLIVQASNSSDKSKKAETEIVKAETNCGSSHSCTHEKGDKSNCDSAKCAQGCCDQCSGDCDPAKCASSCPKSGAEKKCTHHK
jgi:hypothetical protein